MTKRSIFNDISSVFGTKIVVLLLGFISSIILARVLGAEQRGILAAILIYPQILISITEGGMRQAAVVYIGQQKVPDEKIIGALLAYVLSAGLLGYFVCYSLMLFFGDNFDLVLVSIAAAMLPASLAVNAFKGVFLGKQQISIFNKVVWQQKLLYVFSIFMLYVFDSLTLLSAALVTVIAVLFNAAQSIKYLINLNLFKTSFSSKVLFSMLRIGIVYAVALFLIDANYKIDILIMGALSDAAELGNYAIAVQLGELAWQLPSAVVVVLMAQSANSQKENAVNSVCQVCRLTLFATTLIVLGLTFVAAIAVKPIYGDDYEQVFGMLLMLAPGLCVATIFKAINSYYAGQGRPAAYLPTIAIAVSINIALNFTLIPSLGGVGAAIASSISYSIASILLLAKFCREEDLVWREVAVINRADVHLIKQKLSSLTSRITS